MYLQCSILTDSFVAAHQAQFVASGVCGRWDVGVDWPIVESGDRGITQRVLRGRGLEEGGGAGQVDVRWRRGG